MEGDLAAYDLMDSEPVPVSLWSLGVDSDYILTGTPW